MTSSETRLHSGEGTVRFEMVSNLFVNLAPLKRGMTAAAFQSLGISDNTKERLNRLVIGVATIAADKFIKRGSRVSSPAEL